ncbi:SOS response-associated peptidase [Arvimicrobium flavum]|uniref:SOS response-associated peptidase n=1 Tax=Arvimicrobium flavum TaxID=3393320 RepID=UPI00237B22B5|nr:SOS response-associated peptidase [Mesorhizobium shangrilense]
MCGRFALDLTPEDIVALFRVADVMPFPPRYNIPPTEPIMMVIRDHPRPPGSNLPENRVVLVRWGFIPAWAKDPKQLPLLINARSETAAAKNTFKAAMRHRRTLVPASGFYEWKRDGAKRSQPYWVRPRDGSPVAFAGLMETWAEPGGSEIDTGAILTIGSSGELAAIHDRAPVVVHPKDFARWLDCRNQEPRDVADLMQPADPDFFEAIPVSDKVNKVANTGPDLQQRVELQSPAPLAKADHRVDDDRQMRLL